jgi:hypothetical protein
MPRQRCRRPAGQESSGQAKNPNHAVEITVTAAESTLRHKQRGCDHPGKNRDPDEMAAHDVILRGMLAMARHGAARSGRPSAARRNSQADPRNSATKNPFRSETLCVNMD